MSSEKHGEFYFDQENYLCAGRVRLVDFVEKFLSLEECSETVSVEKRNQLIPYISKIPTPVVIYSKQRLIHNVKNYLKSFQEELTEKLGIEASISYSLKANFNPTVLKLFFENGTWASLVNSNELRLALKVGFQGENLIFNGNGKKLSEIELAIRSKCYINIDSMFNLKDTLKTADKLGNKDFLPAKLLLRVNVSSSAGVHSYLDTSGNSKFGIEAIRLEYIIEQIKSNSQLVSLVGFHIHLGSTIKTINIYKNSVENLVTLVNDIIDKHKLESIKIINFGGGLGIDYERFSYRTSQTGTMESQDSVRCPTPKDLAQLIAENAVKLKIKGLKIVVEPGRSLVGDAAILLSHLIGIKNQQNKNFLVIDASMCECIRPCLYSAYHHIDFVSPFQANTDSSRLLYDVVGPVCESGDFLGKNRYLEIPNILTDRTYVAVMDVGAYCSSMANNYNLHSRPAEVFIDQDDKEVKYFLTRRPDTFNDILGQFVDF